MSWPVEKFAISINGKWLPLLKVNLSLKVVLNQLYVLSDNVICETYTMKYIIKGFIKGDVLILINGEKGKQSKSKLKFSCDTSKVNELVNLLKNHFPIQVYDGTQEMQNNTRNFEELLNNEMVRMSSASALGPMFPQHFPLDQFIKTCILDPDFPNFVDQIENIIKNK